MGLNDHLPERKRRTKRKPPETPVVSVFGQPPVAPPTCRGGSAADDEQGPGLMELIAAGRVRSLQFRPDLWGGYVWTLRAWSDDAEMRRPVYMHGFFGSAEEAGALLDEIIRSGRWRRDKYG